MLMRHWMRHTAAVPKGFIRYQVLESLSERPMSGSEIMDDIEQRTNKCWKPSPGSIYPLLAWLQDNGYIRELPTSEGGLKRYELTENGKKLHKELKKIKADFDKKAPFFPPPFLGALWFRTSPEKTFKVRESMRKVMVAFFEFGKALENDFSEEFVDVAAKVLDEATAKLEELTQKIKRKTR